MCKEVVNIAKKAFGGYSVSFKKVADQPISKIFGTGDLAPSEMTKKLWQFVKKNKLPNR
ncbi:MAG: hypothetical protein V1944_02310 [Candidatus Aenigmatarchaeota archaeon]